MDTLLNIIVVEDHDALREITVETLRGEGHHVVGVDCAEALAEMVNTMHVDLMLIDPKKRSCHYTNQPQVRQAMALVTLRGVTRWVNRN